MSRTPQPSADEFLAKATAELFLSSEQSQSLAAESAVRGVSAADLAMEKGVLSAADVEVVEVLLRPGDVVPGYEILGLLGRGGMGVVYRARQINLNRTVALKTVSLRHLARGDMVARFEQEAVTTARLQHPHIVSVYDFGKQAGRLYFVMELVEGVSLDAMITKRGSLGESMAWGIARQVAAGLAFADTQGVVHRDIKPANLLLVEPPPGYPLPPGLPLVKIADFGLAFLADAADAAPRLTMAGTTLGSPNYMAPEQLASSSVDRRADIYALGATVYHMLAGEPPFAGATVGDIIVRKVRGDLPRLMEAMPRISSTSASLVETMMAEKPEQRIGDYRSLLAAIDEAHAESLRKANQPTATLPVSPSFDSFLKRAPVATAETPDHLPSTSTRPVAEARRLVPRAHWRRWGLIGMAAAVLALAAYFAARPFTQSEDAPPKFVASGWERPLYDGSSLDGWRISRGAWSHGLDADKAHVFIGNGAARRSLPPIGAGAGKDAEHYRISLNVDLHEATAVELQFGISGGVAHALRIGDGEAVLGYRAAGDGALTPSVRMKNASLAKMPADAPEYHELRVDRTGGVWWAYVDGAPVGSLPADKAGEIAEFRLVAEGGAAYFEAIHVAELAPTQ